MTIRKAVIAAAGLGTRLLSATKEQPKEMLPVFAPDANGSLCLKPLVQQIFEQLFDCGWRYFYFIVGRGKRAIQDHFTPDRDFVSRLTVLGRTSQALQLEAFYRKLEECKVVWVNQAEPRGFGDAIMQVEPLVGDEPFLVHAGDACILSAKRPLATRLVEAHSTGRAQATLTINEVEDPRQYGVAEVTAGEILDVRRVQEKPVRPESNFAIMPVYIFSPIIFEALKVTAPGVGGEIQLTDAIQELIKMRHRVQAINLNKDDVRLDVGTPETYWETLQLTYRRATSRSITQRSRPS